MELPLGTIRVVAYKTVGAVGFEIDRNELEEILGPSDRQVKSRIWALELHYAAGVYRFGQDGKLKEVSIDSSQLEIEGESVSFTGLKLFFEQCDDELFARYGFLVSPRFGMAFDQHYPSWVTAFTHSELSLWRSIKG
ncbi:hypothetical protein [Acidovorax sp. NB1]|uniref:hypothetical protein n=1 Tax=Acidovorax sp. NB1 TaxID=1943571 RepID=UPI0010E9E2C2|nr:hypothetical protein [Acidovorax sp. NB1]GDY36444.1 hypothetical protein ACINB_23360 [Acidovorax sp. NB1]